MLDMIVSIKSFTYLEGATLYQYTESRHRPDKFKFIDFTRLNQYRDVESINYYYITDI